MSTLPGAQQSLLQHLAEAVVVVAMLGYRQSRGAHSWQCGSVSKHCAGHRRRHLETGLQEPWGQLSPSSSREGRAQLWFLNGPCAPIFLCPCELLRGPCGLNSFSFCVSLIHFGHLSIHTGWVEGDTRGWVIAGGPTATCPEWQKRVCSSGRDRHLSLPSFGTSLLLVFPSPDTFMAGET